MSPTSNIRSIELSVTRNHRHHLPQPPHHHQHHHHQIVNNINTRPQSLSQTIHEASLQQIRPALTKAYPEHYEQLPHKMVKKQLTTKSPTLINIRLDNSRVVKLNVTKLNASCRLCLAFMRYLKEQNCNISDSIPIYI